jgi:HSP20 family molecular chaperone IbpA
MKQQTPQEQWDAFEKTMLEAFPFLPRDFTRGGIVDSSWLSDVVQNTINKYIDQEMKSKFPHSVFGNALSYDTFETHRSVIVRLRLPDGLNPRELELSTSCHKVRVKQPSGAKQEIPLPKAVSPRKARTSFKNGILELRLPKTREPYHPLYVDG